MITDRRAQGRESELRAERYLRSLGFRLLERSFRMRFGEIDLVMQDGGTIVFIEVRARARSDFGSPAATVDRRKQAKIIRTAAAFLQRRRWNGLPARFDVVTIKGDELQHIPHAFSASGFSL